jgi:hypothetical protein
MIASGTMLERLASIPPEPKNRKGPELTDIRSDIASEAAGLLIQEMLEHIMGSMETFMPSRKVSVGMDVTEPMIGISAATAHAVAAFSSIRPFVADDEAARNFVITAVSSLTAEPPEDESEH